MCAMGMELEGSFSLNDLWIDSARHEVRIGQNEIELTLKEFNVLLLLARNKGKVVRRSELLQTLWGPNQPDADRVINVHMCRLRKKIEADPHRPKRIVCVRGLGYRLREQL
jgi:DNA-binding response OmpR family regulator